jgi:hypothetical protein
MEKNTDLSFEILIEVCYDGIVISYYNKVIVLLSWFPSIPVALGLTAYAVMSEQDFRSHGSGSVY